MRISKKRAFHLSLIAASFVGVNYLFMNLGMVIIIFLLISIIPALLLATTLASLAPLFVPKWRKRTYFLRLFLYSGGIILSLIVSVFISLHLLRALEKPLTDHYITQSLPKVSTALAAYKNDNGKYPQTLDEIIPHYLTYVPTFPLLVLSQLSYQYWPDRGEYFMRFNYGDNTYCYRSAETVPDLIFGDKNPKPKEWSLCWNTADAMSDMW